MPNRVTQVQQSKGTQTFSQEFLRVMGLAPRLLLSLVRSMVIDASWSEGDWNVE